MARILLVEDDADVHAVVSEFLGTIGHQVISASCAKEARDALLSKTIDLTVIDCLMSGEQGSSLAECFREVGIPVIMTSGDPHYLEMFGGRSEPFLPKPFRLGELGELISRILRPLPGQAVIAEARD